MSKKHKYCLKCRKNERTLKPQDCKDKGNYLELKTSLSEVLLLSDFLFQRYKMNEIIKKSL